MIHNTSGVERTELSKLKIGDYIKMQIIKDKNGIYTLIGKDETEEGSHSFGVFDFIKYKRGKLVSDSTIDGDGRGTLTLGFTFDNINNIFPTGLLYGDRQLRILSHSEMIDLDTYTFNDMIDKRFFSGFSWGYFPTQESYYNNKFYSRNDISDTSGWTSYIPSAMILIYDYVDNPNSENIYY